MEKAFLTLLNMSITASYVILFVLLVRIPLKKAPRIFSYGLWSVVLFRLVCPFSFSSALSFFGFFKTSSMEHIPANLGYMPKPQGNVGVDALDNLINSSLPSTAPTASADKVEIIIFILSLLWIAGVIGLLIYYGISYIRLQRKVSTAILISDNIYKCENIKSSFVMGVIKPRIYLPASLLEKEKGYILMHERIHIKRFDYLIKPLAFFAACLHWFNPLVWMSFVLMSQDMEMSCDEGVLKEMGRDIKKDYSSSLLAQSIDKSMINGIPLAFGEGNVKSRIKNVLNYKKPGFWMLAAGVIMVSIAGVGLISNPREDKGNLTTLNPGIIASQLPADENKVSTDIKKLVEDNIAIIISTPGESSNPEDYIKANQNAYENIIKYGGENALNYMIAEFKKGNVGNDLRGQIMMRLCKELLGVRNDVSDTTLLPNEWFKKLSIRNKIELPDYTYEGNDAIQSLVYSTEIEKNKGTVGEFTIVAPHIFCSYEEGNMLKVFATTFSQHYILYDTTLSEEGGSIIPVAITYVKDSSGNYTLKKYEQAGDGSEFLSSIKKFCIMPMSGKRINNLADRIIKHYGDYNDIIKLERENLIEHLKKNNLFGVSLYKKYFQKPDELIPIT